MKYRPSFTLLELLISVSISALIFVLLSQVTVDTLRIYRGARANTAASERANQVVSSMIRTIRQSQPSPTGAYPIIAATDTSMTVFSASNTPGVVQQIRYFINGTDLQRGVIEPTGSPATYPAGNEVVTTVLANVRNGGQPLFQYYTGSFTGTEAAMNPIVLNSIRYAQATILYDENLNEPPSMITVALGISFRNLKDNY